MSTDMMPTRSKLNGNFILCSLCRPCKIQTSYGSVKNEWRNNINKLYLCISILSFVQLCLESRLFRLNSDTIWYWYGSEWYEFVFYSFLFVLLWTIQSQSDQRSKGSRLSSDSHLRILPNFQHLKSQQYKIKSVMIKRKEDVACSM